MHQKCSNYALTNLLFSLCKFVGIIDPFFIHPSPHPKAPTRPFTPKVLQVKERTPIFYSFIIFTLGLALESIKEFGGVSNIMWEKVWESQNGVKEIMKCIM